MKFETSVLIGQPVADVFDYVSSRSTSRWNSAVRSVRELSPGNGDIACELVTVGVREPMTVRVVEADPPRRLVEARVDGKRESTSIFEIEPEGEHASRVTLTAEVELGGLARALGPLASRGVKRRVDSNFADLKRILEAP
jgi:carbon monoxide dehydrogenase subunit G